MSFSGCGGTVDKPVCSLKQIFQEEHWEDDEVAEGDCDNVLGNHHGDIGHYWKGNANQTPGSNLKILDKYASQ